MIKISASPLIVAASLGLLGPAALVDDDNEPATVAGQWMRVGGAPEVRVGALAGDQLEVIPFEDGMLIDDGSGLRLDQGTWSHADGVAVQILHLDDGRIVREFAVTGDALCVHTTVVAPTGDQNVFTERFSRKA